VYYTSLLLLAHTYTRNLKNVSRFAGHKAVYVVGISFPVIVVLLLLASFVDNLYLVYIGLYTLYTTSMAVYFIYASWKVKKQSLGVPSASRGASGSGSASSKDRVTARLVKLARIVVAANVLGIIMSIIAALTVTTVDADVVMVYVLVAKCILLVWVMVLLYAFWPRKVSTHVCVCMCVCV
jgi:hypothetical protein